MFRKMRSKKNQIGEEETRALLKTARCGVLAVQGDHGYPYALPINYFFDEQTNKIYFHSAKKGSKTDALKKEDKICFTVYSEEMIKEEAWAPFVQSAVLFGRCTALENPKEALEYLRRFAMKYYPNKELAEQEIESAGKAVRMYQIEIEHLTGKEVQEK